ncbi:hypothetical protein [Candidatus Amarobacter glycogenicus]|uniref:hypothetical protein n=1 Tax=Candidatus Amarobacter glycogenicus TaxID=3140699 RepID=UPI0031CC8C1D
MARSPPGAEAKFAQRSGARVILDEGRDAQPFGDRRREDEVSEAGNVRREDDLALIRIDQPGCGDADR